MSFSFLLCSSCAYHVGFTKKQLLGGYRQVSIPMFENKTQQVGAEAYFTNALVREFHRSNNIKVRASSPVTIEGCIESIRWTKSAIATGPSTSSSARKAPLLPSDRLLIIEYRVQVQTKILLRKNSDQAILWQKKFTHEDTYSAPQVGLEIVNTSNTVYNYSARHKALEKMAKNMMAEVHKYLFEDF